MPKLIWVGLPLLMAAVWLSVQALRGRSPSRHALNIGSSVLLVTYVATTAGLGIFWVANQQLPVFDWHYLFGYMTVLLVALHLSFNFRIVWRYLTRSRNAAATAIVAEEADTAWGRRRLIGAIGVVAAAGAAFVLGLRHGRSELRVAWPQPLVTGANSASAGAPDSALAFVERFHAFSSTSRSGVLLRAPSLDWGNPPPPFKRYFDAPQALPPPRTAARPRFDLAGLSATLWHTAGVTESRGPIKLRAAPSSGALFSTELYVVARDVPGLAAGLWHYDPETHALHRLATRAASDEFLDVPGDPALRDATALVIATAIFRRTGHKYRDRTYRYVLADLGHALENLRVAAGVVGARAQLLERFDESRAAMALGIDEAEEGVLAMVALHPRAAGAAGAAIAARTPPAVSRWLTPPSPAAKSLPLGVTSAMHLASSLRTAAPPAIPPALPGATTSPGAIVLPRGAASAANPLDVITTRRSVRRFAPTALALDALAGVLHGMAAGGTAQLSSAVRLNVVVHAVTGLPPGAYRYDADAQVLVARRPSADLRGAARAAALDQDVIGDAAVVFVLSIDRAAFAADPAGPARGYRHAFIESGLIGERVYLEAGARGLGACAVGAFYDEEAAALVTIDPAREWVVHFAALGVPSR